MSDAHTPHAHDGCACNCVGRRTILKGAAAAGLVGLSGASAFAQTPGAPVAPADLPAQVGDFFVLQNGTEPLTVDQIRVGGAPSLVYPMAPDGTIRSGLYDSTVQLLRYEVAELSPEVAAKSAEGVLGYTVICTHAGCPVATDLTDGHVISCDCHGSRFDATANGAVVMGPAIRKLPQVGLGVQDGKIVVVEAFDGRIGADTSGEDDR